MAQHESVPRSFKSVIVGDSGVGKTCLLLVKTTDVFPKEHIPDVMMDSQVTIMCEGYRYLLELYDTDDRDENSIRMRKLKYFGADIFLVCFSVINRDSLNNVRYKWLPEIMQFYPKTPWLLVGTKSDLKEDPSYNSSVISIEEASEIADQCEASAYLECSALDSYSVKRVFDETVYQRLLRDPKPKSDSRTMCHLL